MDEEILALAAKAPHWIFAVSKDDLNPGAGTAAWTLPNGLRKPDASVSFNSVHPGGLDTLLDAVKACFPAGTPDDAGSLLTNARQESAVQRSLDAVRALTAPARRPDSRCGADRCGGGAGNRGRVDRPHRQEEIVGAVFSRFCVGK